VMTGTGSMGRSSLYCHQLGRCAGVELKVKFGKAIVRSKHSTVMFY